MMTPTNILVPRVPSEAHLISIAVRMRHDFGLLPPNQQQNCLAEARQLYEEATGQGFYQITIEDLVPRPGPGLGSGSYKGAQD